MVGVEDLEQGILRAGPARLLRPNRSGEQRRPD
jgi:hypothetical protein